ncbi:MAG: hypothetical protein M1826_001137 [Phylliscum demangeonii]|nr:MAG: hypothetical protein M1826_001137 [Phylliscum demangeonii]
MPRTRRRLKEPPLSPKRFDKWLEMAQVVQNMSRPKLGLRQRQHRSCMMDFSAFLKKRSALEEEHGQDLKKLCRTTHDGIRRPEHRQGSYAERFDEFTTLQERMSEHGLAFANALHQMHDELVDVTNSAERGRKHWKQTGLSAEKRLQDGEQAMDKAKSKYESLAEDYDRARTGDRGSGKKFGLKGPRTAAQLEEDLQRKVQTADQDYAAKIQTANALRYEMLTSIRPQATKTLQELIRECDAAVTMQMQKFVTVNEAFVMNNGLCLSPMKETDGQAPASRSLREIVSEIDNDRDLHQFVAGLAPKVPSKPVEYKYERHPSLIQQQQQQQPTPPSANRVQQLNPDSRLPPQSFTPIQMASQSQPPRVPQHESQAPLQPFLHHQTPSPDYQRTAPLPYPTGPSASSEKFADMDLPLRGPAQQPSPLLHLPSALGMAAGGPSQLAPTQYGVVSHQQFPPPLAPPPSQQQQQQQALPSSTPPPAANGSASLLAADLPPLKPVFGVSLEELYRRDGSAVPIIVYQCLQAVDLFGLEVEGIYRLSGTSSHVARIKAMFDHDSSLVDFRNPENFLHDVNSVAGALKLFFRDLPDPLLTREHYSSFIFASRTEDDVVRRDSLHAVINNLPDPNYATLRALILHLHRVQERFPVNRMNTGNLAICFGPTLMGSHTGPNIADAGWQARTIDTILQNTYQIFDDD